jgi:hypothetical protein
LIETAPGDPWRHNAGEIALAPVAIVHTDTAPYIDVPGRPRRYLGRGTTAEFDRDAHRREAERFFGPVRDDSSFSRRAERL